MKSISRLAAVLLLSTSFATPVLVSAAGGTVSPGGSCGSDGQCAQGTCINMTGNPLSGVCSPAGGGGGATLNRTYLDFYYYLVVNVINSIFVPILIAISFFMVLYGAYKYFILKSAEEGERQMGRTVMLYGVIGLVVIFSVWALVNIVRDTIIPGSATQTVPKYPTL